MNGRDVQELKVMLDYGSLQSAARLRDAFDKKGEPNPLDVLVVRAMIASESENYGHNPWDTVKKHGLHWAGGAGVGSIIVTLIQQVGAVLGK